MNHNIKALLTLSSSSKQWPPSNLLNSKSGENQYADQLGELVKLGKLVNRLQQMSTLTSLSSFIVYVRSS